MDAYAALEQRFARWAASRPDVRAAIVIGSRARREHPADEWSDLDLIVFCADPRAYTADPAWLDALGEVWVPLLDDTGGGDPEWLVLLDGGLKIDLVFGLEQPTWAARLAPFRGAIARGVRVAFDKDARPGLAEAAAAPASPPPADGDEAAFRRTLYQFWVYAARTAKWLRRGDLWPATSDCDTLLKQRLLAMLEWHARATRGADTWHAGRFMAEWADPRALAALPATFATYDAAAIWRALDATLDLFHWLARETAARRGYAYPAEAEARVSAWIRAARSA